MRISTELLNVEASNHDGRDLIIEGINHPHFDFPEKVDLREHLPNAWDQGADGPCSAYAAAAIKMYHEFKDYGSTEELSRYFVYNLRSNYPAKGMTPRDTMKILQKWGIPFRSSFKKRWNSIDEIPQEVLDEAANHKILGYARIMTIDGLKKSLYKNGPAYIAMPVYNDGEEFWKAQYSQRIMGGHALVVVGYTDKGFILRNSWGRDWAWDGHALYRYEDFGMHYEIWTAIDDLSSEPVISVREKKKIERKKMSLIDRILSIFR